MELSRVTAVVEWFATESAGIARRRGGGVDRRGEDGGVKNGGERRLHALVRAGRGRARSEPTRAAQAVTSQAVTSVDGPEQTVSRAQQERPGAGGEHGSAAALGS